MRKTIKEIITIAKKEKKHLLLLGLAAVVSSIALNIWPICLAAIGPWTLVGLEIREELKLKKEEE